MKPLSQRLAKLLLNTKFYMCTAAILLVYLLGTYLYLCSQPMYRVVLYNSPIITKYEIGSEKIFVINDEKVKVDETTYNSYKEGNIYKQSALEFKGIAKEIKDVSIYIFWVFVFVLAFLFLILTN